MLRTIRRLWVRLAKNNPFSRNAPRRARRRIFEPLESRVCLSGAWDVVLIDGTLDRPDLLANAALDGTRVILYDGQSESPEQVLNRVVSLSRSSGWQIGSLSILSHGGEGRFSLGDQTLSARDLSDLSDAWKRLGAVMSADGNIYLYGCNVASPFGTSRILDKLARLTGAEVFASTNLTGAGGDWTLEAANTGAAAELRAGLQSPFSEQTLSAYESTLAIPVAPSVVKANASSSSSIVVQWTDNSSDETGFKIERAAHHAGAPWVEIATVGANVTSYTDTGLAEGVTHHYRVRAYNLDGNSAYNIDDPRQYGATTFRSHSVKEWVFASKYQTQSGGVDNYDDAIANANLGEWVRFTDFNFDEFNVTQFRLRIASDFAGGQVEVRLDSSTGTKIATVDVTATGGWVDPYFVDFAATLTTSVSGVHDVYLVFSAVSGGAGTAGNLQQFTFGTTTVAEPTNFSTSAVAAKQINLSWTDNSSNESGFVIERSTNQYNSFTVITTTAAGATSYSDLVPSTGTRYFYRIRATHATGQSRYTYPAISNTTLATPTNLSATTVTSSSVTLNWTDNSSNESGFTIERSATADFSVIAQTYTVAAGVTSYTASSLGSGTTYYFRIRATHSGGYSSNSNTAGATTSTSGTVPTAPSGLSATTASKSQINLSWTDNSSNESGFKIERSLDGSTGWIQIATAAAGATSFSATGLSPSTTYYFRVRAYNATGSSAYTATANATTSANVAPAVTTTGSNLAYTENAGAVLIDSGLTLSDADDTYIEGATIQITGNYASGEDALGFTTQNGIIGTWDPTTGTLTLTGTATAANYQAALRSVTYTNSSDVPSALTRTVTFSVSDGVSSGNAARGIAITAVNDAPVNSVPSAQIAERNGSLVFSGGNGNLISIVDVDAGAGSLEVALSVTNGTLTLSGTAGLSFSVGDGTADGSMTFTGTLANINAALAGMSYTPTTNYAGPATLSITTDDQGNSGGAAESDTDNLSISVMLAAPTNLTATPASGTQINLSWADNSAEETGFEIERSTDGSTWSLIHTTAANATSYSNTGLTVSTTYYYRIRATDGGNYSAYTPTVHAPTMFAGSAVGDDFNYTNGANLVGQSGGNGWSGSWATGGTAPTATINSTGLTYSNLYTSGGRVSISAGDAKRNLSTTLGANGTAKWFSFLLRRDSGSGGGQRGGIVIEGSTARFYVGIYGSGGGPAIHIENLSTGTRTSTGISASGTIRFVAVKISFAAGNDTVEVFVDPTPGSTAPTAAAATMSSADGGTVSAIAVMANGTTTSVDEIRVGDSYEAVAPLSDAPSGLTATAASSSQINLSWTDNSSDELGFRIERSPDGSTWADVGSAAAGATGYSDTGLSSSTTYHYRVRAYDGTTSTAYSGTAGATTQVYITLTATAVSETKIKLSWTDVAGETGYELERSPDGSTWAQIDTPGAGETTYTDDGLSENTTYHYRVRATGTGNSSYSATQQATTLTDFIVDPFDDGGVTNGADPRDVAWTKNASTMTVDGGAMYNGYDTWNQGFFGAFGSAINLSASYKLRLTVQFWADPLSANPSGFGFGLYNGTPQTTSDFDQYNAGPNIRTWGGYYGNIVVPGGGTQIQRNNSGGDDHPYFDVTAVGAAGSNVGNVDSAWRWARLELYLDGSGNVVSNMYVGASLSALGLVASGTDSTASKVTTGFRNVMLYIQSDTNYGIKLDNIAAETVPMTVEAPTGLSATAASSSQVDLSWTDNSAGENGFKIERSLDGNTWTEIAVTSPDVTSYSDTGLSSRTTYYYRVRAYDTDGNTSYTSTASATTPNAAATVNTTAGSASFTEGGGAVVIDSGLTISDDETHLEGATIQITGNYANGEDVLSFTDTANITGSWDASTGTLTLSGTDTVANYQAALRAVTYQNTSGSPSTLTRTISFIVNDGDVNSSAVTRTVEIAPAAPGGVSGTPISTSRIDLSWTDNSDIEDGFKIERSADGSTGWTEIDTVGAGVTTYSNTGLSAGTTYHYRIRAYRGSYNSAYSSVYVVPTMGTQISAQVNDGFAYTGGQNLVGQSGGVGWGGAWTDGGSAAATTSATGQTYSTLTSSGGSVNVTAGTATRNLASSFGTDGGTMWIGFLYRKNSGSGGHSGMLGLNGSNGRLDIGFSSYNGGNFKLQTGSGAANSASYGPTTGTTYFLVVKMTFAAGNDTFQLYINPTPGTTDPVTADVTKPDLDLGTVTSAMLMASGGDFSFDQIRIGSSYGAVAPTSSADAPADLTATAVSTSQVNLSWTDSNSGELGYRIERSTDGNTWADIGTAAADATTYSDTGLSSNTTYYYRVRAYDGSTSTPYSNSASSTTHNVAPTLGGIEGAALAYTENGAATAITGSITVSDSDDTLIEGATVQITGNYANGEDVLSFTDANGITGSWDASTGTLTLSGSATLANYQTALRSITYHNTSNNPGTSTRTVSFTISDGAASSNTVTRDVGVTATNDVPAVTAGGTLNFSEGDAASVIDGGLTLADLDDTNLEGATVQITGNYANGQDVLSFTDTANITGSWDAGTGTLTLSGTDTVAAYQAALRSVKYGNTSENPSASARTVTISASDGTGSGSATATVNVTAVNDAPMLGGIEGTTLAYTENDAATAITGSITLSDADDTDIEGATVQITGNYQNGQDALAFTDTANITGSWDASTGTLTLSGTDTVANYQAALRAVTYANTSNNPSTSTRTVSFTANDGSANSNTVTRDVSVSAANDAPTVGTNSGLTVTEGASGTITSARLSISDPDNTAAQIVFTIGTATGNGTLYKSGVALAATDTFTQDDVDNNRITYTHDGSETLSDSFTFTVSDGAGGSIGSTTFNITVTAANDTPAVTSGATLGYAEGDAATAVDGALTISDPDDTNLEGATVQITGNYANGQDVLSFTDTANITGSWDASTGTLTLSGTDTVAAYQAALRSVKYANTSENPSTLSRTVTFGASDGTASGTATATVTVTAANDAPALAGIEGTTLGYTENDAATAITGSITLSDADDTSIEGVTVQITGNYQNGQDVLAFTDTANITGSWDASTGTLTLSGTDTVANYQAALRAVTYANTSNDPSTSTRTISFTANDGSANSNTVTRDMSVSAVNDAPVNSVPAAQNTDENVALIFSTANGNLISISDADAGGNSVEVTLGVTNGTLTLGGVIGLTFSVGDGIADASMTFTGTIAAINTALDGLTFDPTLNYAGSATLTITTDDQGNGGSGGAQSDSDNVTININDIATAPDVTTTGPALSYTENDGAAVVDAGVTISDPDSATMVGATIQITGNYANGQDVLAFTDTANITGSWDATTGTLTLTGTDTMAAYQAALRTITYTNTSDNPSTLARTVRFIVNDGTSNSDPATRNITVAAANDAPTLAGVEGTALGYTENDAATAITGSITLSDVDDTNIEGATVQITGNYANGEDLLSFTDTANITGSWDAGTGTLTLSGTDTVAAYQAALRAVRYSNTSDDPSTSTRTVSFTVNDGTANSNTATRDVSVTAANDAPALAAIEGTTLSYTENDAATAVTGSITLSDADDTNIEGATIQITGNYQNGQDVLAFIDTANITGSWDASTGTLTLSGTDTVAAYQAALRSITYANTSNNPSTLTRTVSFTASDGSASSNTVTREVSVTAANDTPTVTSGATLGYAEGDAATAVDGALTISDPDDTNLEGATVQITGNYQNGQDVLSFTDTANITGSWDASTGTLTLSGTDTVAAYQAALRSVKYANTSENPSTPSRTVTFSASDGTASGTATATVTVAAANDAPALAAIEGATLSYTENDAATSITGSITLSDADDTDIEGATVQITGNYQNGQDVLGFTDTANIAGSWDASTGTLTLSGTDTVAAYQAALRAVTYANTSNDPGTVARTVSFTVSDGTASSNAVTRDVSVTAANDAPALAGIEGTTLGYTENDAATAISGSITLSDADDTNIEGATVQITGNYANGQDVLSFTDTANITGSWDASTGTLTLSGTDTKAAYQAALRAVTYANTSNDPSTLARTVSFTVSDGTASSNTVTRDVSVTAANDAPTLSNNTGMTLNEGASGTVTSARLSVSDPDNSATDLVYTLTAAPSNGTLYKSGVALSDNDTFTQDDIDNNRITYTHSSGETTSDGFTFTVSDGAGGSIGSTTFSITVTAVNDAPSLGAIEGTTLAYTEDDAATAITGSITVSDADDTLIEGAVIQITGNYQNGQDVLAFTDTANITGSWDATTGTLTLSGSDTVAAYQAALRSVTYQNTSNTPSTLTRTVSFTVNDGDTDGNTVTRDVSVAADNDAPAVTTSGGSHSHTENDGPSVIDSGVTITDADDGNLEGATIQITGNYVNGEDVLGFTDQNGITGSWDAGTGTMTLTGTATVAQYQAALRSVTYLNASDDPSTLARTVSFTVNDGTDNSNTATRGVSVVAINDAPALTGTGGTLAYAENDAATVVDSGLTLSDPDDASMEGATVQITDNYANGQDVLAFTDQNGITGSWDATTGTLTLSGTSSVANYQAALRSITYANTSNDPSTLTRTVSFAVSDGTDNSNTETRDVSVSASNDAPTLTPTGGSLGYTEGDGAVAVDAGLAVADLDDSNIGGATVQITGNYQNGQDVLAFTDTANITGSWDAGTGTLTLSGTDTVAAYQAALRSITYTNASENPSTLARTVSFTVSDGTANSNTATRGISITAVNDAPALAGVEGTTLGYTEGDAATAITGSITVSDADDTNIEGATVQITGNYTNGEDLLEFTDTANITGSWDASTGTLTLSGTDTVAAYQAALRSVTYRNASQDPVTLTRTVSFTLTDGTDSSNTVTRDVSVAAVNDAPVVSAGGTLNYAENDAATAIDGALTVADADDATLTGATVQITGNYQNGQDVLSFTDTANITGSWDATTGTLTLSGSDTVAAYQAALRAVTYANTSNNPNTSTRTVSFTVSDGTASSNTVTRDLSVTAANDAPALAGIEGTTLGYTENDAATSVTGSITLSDADDTNIEGATVQITGNYANGEDVLGFANTANITASWDASTGTLTLSGTDTVAAYQAALRSITYANTSDDPSTLTRTVSFTVNDGDTDGNTVTRDVSVTAVNDAPALAGIEGTTLGYSENDGATSITGAITLSDSDDTNIEGATVQITGNYANGQDVLGFTDTANITGSWDASTGTLTLSGSDTMAAYQAALRSITYANTSNDPSTLNRTVSFTVSDGTSNSNAVSRDVSVTAANDAPVVTPTGSSLSYTENDGAVAIDAGLSVSDPDDTLIEGATVQITGNYANGQDVLSFTDTGTITGSWDAGTGTLTLSGADTVAAYQAALRSVTYQNTSNDPSTLNRTVSFTADDGTATTTATRTIVVTAVNDAPVLTATPGSSAFTEDGAAVVVDSGVSISDLDDTDIEGATVQITGNYASGQDALNLTDQNGITGSWDATTGTLTLTGTATLAEYQAALRSITYANASQDPSTAARTVSFTVNDGTGNSNTVTRGVSVAAVNDAPTVATAVSGPGTTSGTTAALSVLGADVDDGEAGLTYTWSVTAKPAGAADPTYSANGTNAAKNTTATFSQIGTYTFQVTISDGSASVTSSVSVTVSPALSSIAVSPASSTMDRGQLQIFTATARDQFGDDLAVQPVITWAVVGSGSVDQDGLYTAGHPGSAAVTASSGGVSGTANVTVRNNAPTVVTPASATPATTESTADLSVLGDDDGDEINLTYTWSATAKPAGAADPTYSANGTNAAKNTTATFSKAGAYTLTVTISDGSKSTTSSVVVTVTQKLTTVVVSPASAAVVAGQTQQFTATGYDQFNDVMSVSPAFTWSVDAGGKGSVSSAGLYTAPKASGGSATVRATSGTKSASATVSITSAAPASPSGLLAAASSESQIGLVWSDNSGNEDVFEVERSSDGVTWTLVGNAPANSTQFIDVGLNPDTTYYYRVRAVSEDVVSGYSEVASARTFARLVEPEPEPPPDDDETGGGTGPIEPPPTESPGGQQPPEEPEGNNPPPPTSPPPTTGGPASPPPADGTDAPDDVDPSRPEEELTEADPVDRSDESEERAEVADEVDGGETETRTARGETALAMGRAVELAGVPTVELPQVPVHVSAADLYRAVAENPLVQQHVDAVVQEVVAEAHSQSRTVQIFAGAAATTTATVSIGYLLWALRAGSLLASMLTALPFWKWFDPLPVLDSWESERKRQKKDKKSKGDGDDDDEVKSVVD